VDFRVDLTRIMFEDNTFDVVFASHVLEHVPDDIAAMKEVLRVLKPGGIALLPVPVIGPVTVEYGQARELEEGHVRMPGEDYFDRMRSVFDEVRVFCSDDFDACYQLYCYEDRSLWPEGMSTRPKVKGKKHADHVPVCRKKKTQDRSMS
jgi:ubiquinone/menaquinone biosynthesis C-methylase UbiE